MAHLESSSSDLTIVYYAICLFCFVAGVIVGNLMRAPRPTPKQPAPAPLKRRPSLQEQEQAKDTRFAKLAAGSQASVQVYSQGTVALDGPVWRSLQGVPDRPVSDRTVSCHLCDAGDKVHLHCQICNVLPYTRLVKVGGVTTRLCDDPRCYAQADPPASH